ncbi:MAG: hypothetical protein KGZ58_01110 [Ignavibacteriales bacterium]|nr:hypothetical protein [Ignavibacteriales bacterium]
MTIVNQKIREALKSNPDLVYRGVEKEVKPDIIFTLNEQINVWVEIAVVINPADYDDSTYAQLFRNELDNS